MSPVGQAFLSATAFHAVSKFGIAWKAMADRNVCPTATQECLCHQK